MVALLLLASAVPPLALPILTLYLIFLKTGVTWILLLGMVKLFPLKLTLGVLVHPVCVYPVFAAALRLTVVPGSASDGPEALPPAALLIVMVYVA